MRFEYQCICGADLATQDDDIQSDEQRRILETIHDNLVNSHIRNCKMAKRNFILSDVNKNGD